MKKLAILATTAFCALAISTASAQSTKKDSSVRSGSPTGTTTKGQVETTRPGSNRNGTTTTDGARDARPNGSSTNGTRTQPTEPNNNGTNMGRPQPTTTPNGSGNGSNGSTGSGNGSNGSAGSGSGSTPATPPRK